MPGIKDWGIYVALTFASMTAMGGTPHLTLDITTQIQPHNCALMRDDQLFHAL
jgi:hypothetical protein